MRTGRSPGRGPGRADLLLEAGGSDRTPLISTPALVAAAIATPRLNWRFETVPQPQLKGRRIPQPRGKVVGGSGSINGMVYSRGNPRDYDDWAAAGATGWNYASVLPYFTRSENNEERPASVYHGRGGPMNVRTPARPNRLNSAFIAATAEPGFSAAPRLDRAGLRGRGSAPGSDTGRHARNHGARVSAPGAASWQCDAAIPRRWRMKIIVESGRAVGRGL